MVFSSVRNDTFSADVTLGVDSLDLSPALQHSVPLTVLPAQQQCLDNKDLYLFCMVWGGRLLRDVIVWWQHVGLMSLQSLSWVAFPLWLNDYLEGVSCAWG